MNENLFHRMCGKFCLTYLFITNESFLIFLLLIEYFNFLPVLSLNQWVPAFLVLNIITRDSYNEKVLKFMSGPSETSDYIVQTVPFYIKSKQKGSEHFATSVSILPCMQN